MRGSDRKNPTNPQRPIVPMTSTDFGFEPQLWGVAWGNEI